MQLYDRLWVYSKSLEAKSIQDGYQVALDELVSSRDMAEAQCFVMSATWGLEEWEQYLGLAHDPSLNLARRQERIIAKLRGSGVTTVAMIKSVAESFFGGACIITEHFADYYFTIRFTAYRGEPPGFAQLAKILEEIKPAHLGIQFSFWYRTYGELRPYTHHYLSQYTHDEVRVEDFGPQAYKNSYETLGAYTHDYLAQYTSRQLRDQEGI